jgi:uncharacterized membrane protein
MSPRTLRIVWIVSILANIFLLAAVVGGTVWLRAKHPMITAGSIRIAGAELPRDERRAFRTVLRETRRSMHPTVLAARQAREDAATLLRAPVLDQAALSAALARARVADVALREQLEARAVAFAATLPPADRARLADGMLRRPEAQHEQAKPASDGNVTAAR